MSEDRPEYNLQMTRSPISTTQENGERISNARSGHDEIALSEVLQVLRSGRWLILAITTAFAAVALLLALILPKEYRATILVYPVSVSKSNDQLSSLANAVPGVGSIASMFGISSHGGNAAKDVATLESQILTREFITTNHLMPVLFPKVWDAKTNGWRTTNSARIPTLWKANLLFRKKIRTVSLDEKTGLIKLSIVWNDPTLAAIWANSLVALANQYLRARAINRENRKIKYLSDEAQKTSVVAVRQGIYMIMQQEIANEMMAKGQRQYAMRVIDPAFAPEAAASPRPVLWTLSGIIGGLLFSCGWVVFRASLREAR